MPSIPQSLLWISLVVLWLFVLVPMLINKRDTVRRTSDVALATRVLNSGVKSRLIKRSGPAAGHRHDPDWQHDDEFAGEFVEDYPDHTDEELAEQREAIMEYDDAVRDARMGARVRSVVIVAAVSEQTLSEPDYLDVDIVDENSGALPVGGAGVQASLFDPPLQEEKSRPVTADAEVPRPQPRPAPQPEPEPIAEQDAERIRDRRATARAADDYEYEYVDDTSGLEAEHEAPIPMASRSANRRRRLETTSAAAVDARKYRFRKRLLIAMVALMALTAVLSFTVSPTLWWSCGAVAGVLVLYLGYLRRQTRIEEQVRRRRQQRMARSRSVVEEAVPPRMPEVDFDDFPTRLQRPGAVVLEIDDEDPVFEHLDEVAYSRRFDPRDLPRAAGQ